MVEKLLLEELLSLDFLLYFSPCIWWRNFSGNLRIFKAIDTIIGIICIGATILLIRVSTSALASLIFLTANIVAAVLSLLMTYNHRNDKKNELAFLRGLMLLLAGILINFFSENFYGLVFSMALLAMALYNMYGYFHDGNYKRINAKIDEAEKLKAAVEKDLNYEVKKRMFEIERSNERLLEISKTDALTKAYNKSAILNIIDKQCSLKNPKPFSVMMFDVDYFKQINDKLGHITGDICLKTLANIAFGNIRSIDYFWPLWRR